MVKTISPTGLSFRNISFNQRGGAKTSYPWPWSAAGTEDDRSTSKVWKDCEDDLWDCMRLIPGKKTYVFGCWTVGQMPFFPPLEICAYHDEQHDADGKCQKNTVVSSTLATVTEPNDNDDDVSNVNHKRKCNTTTAMPTATVLVQQHTTNRTITL